MRPVSETVPSVLLLAALLWGGMACAEETDFYISDNVRTESNQGLRDMLIAMATWQENIEQYRNTARHRVYAPNDASYAEVMAYLNIARQRAESLVSLAQTYRLLKAGF